LAAPTVRGVGAAGAAASVAVPAGTAEGDLLIIIGEDNGSGIMTASGWTGLIRVAWTGTNPSALSVLGKIAGAGEGAAIVTADVNHARCQMIGITVGTHGIATVATDVVVGSGNNNTGATGTALGITVTADSLILICSSTTRDFASTTQFSGFTNANLASITERMDSVISQGVGGGIGMASGTCAGTTTGDSTFTLATSEGWTAVHIGIKPAAAAAMSLIYDTGLNTALMGR
jgi:hypothetical protein